MSEIKPVYQVRVRFNLWEDQTKEQYEDSKFGDGVPRILYPAASYEALQEKLDRLNGLYHSEVSKHQLDYNALKAESAAQAKRIEELEAATYHLGLTPQQASDGLARYKAQVAEIESLRKQVEALGHKAPTASGFCSRDGGCVCGGDLPRIRESCGSWVKPASKNGE